MAPLVLAGFGATPAWAEDRPTEGGLWSFDATDVVQTWDDPVAGVRVHYSVQGPNATLLADADDGVPDFVQQAAEAVGAARAFYAIDLGLRPPVEETAVGEALGGSEDLDVYLVDFRGAADGRFGIDACDGDGHCAGFLVIENDFLGYGYASTDEALGVVGSHELFHAVQAAYAELPIWISEGTATWATRRFDETLPDFIRQCAGYLADPGRPVHQPPPGPVPLFAYGTALWFEFATAQLGDAWIGALLEAVELEPDAPAEAMVASLSDEGAPIEDLWVPFARANLAAGHRAGVASSHPYAAQLEPIEAAAEGYPLDLDARIYPLAAEYWRIDHPGDALLFGADASLPDVVFSLHPVGNFEADGAVGDPIALWDAEQPGSFDVYGEPLPEGGYWIVATLPVLADGSAQARVCVGDADHVEACGLPPREDDEVVDGTGTTGDAAADGTTDGTTDGTANETGDGTGIDSPQRGPADGCSCRGTPPASWAVLLLVVGLVRRCRR